MSIYKVFTEYNGTDVRFVEADSPEDAADATGQQFLDEHGLAFGRDLNGDTKAVRQGIVYPCAVRITRGQESWLRILEDSADLDDVIAGTDAKNGINPGLDGDGRFMLSIYGENMYDAGKNLGPVYETVTFLEDPLKADPEGSEK